VTSHSLDIPSLVRLSHSRTPLERDVLFGRPQRRERV